jgi:very-short-patch-repair endonuclease
LWKHLRGRQVEGAYFRRQHPVGDYFADFYCTELMLVVVVDGSQHSESPHDHRRDAWLTERGYTVLRFWNGDVLTRTSGVIEKILATIVELRTSRPPP